MWILLENHMPKTQTRPWDVTEHLETEEDMAAYLEAALEEGDSALMAAALGDIARAKGMIKRDKDPNSRILIAKERTDARNTNFR
jgi:DNA-binding phage protein